MDGMRLAVVDDPDEALVLQLALERAEQLQDERDRRVAVHTVNALIKQLGLDKQRN